MTIVTLAWLVLLDPRFLHLYNKIMQYQARYGSNFQSFQVAFKLIIYVTSISSLESVILLHYP